MSSQDHLSTDVNYQIYGSHDKDFSRKLLSLNTINDKEYFKFDETGTGEHFNGFPIGGLNKPDRNSLVRFQFLKENIQDVFVSKSNNLFCFSPDVTSIIDSIQLKDSMISCVSSDCYNQNVFMLGTNKMIYVVPNNINLNDMSSLYASSNVLSIKIDGIRNNLWQIEKNKIRLTDLNNNQILSVDLPDEIKEVIDIHVVKNTGHLFFIAKSDYASSGTFLVSYNKNRYETRTHGGDMDLITLDVVATSLGEWGAFNTLVGDGTNILKKFEIGRIENLLNLTSSGINIDVVSGIAKNKLYILDRNVRTLSKIDMATGYIYWQTELPYTNYNDNLSIKNNNTGSYIYFWSNDIVGVVEDNGGFGTIRGYVGLTGTSNVKLDLIKRNNSNIWIKYGNI